MCFSLHSLESAAIRQGVAAGTSHNLIIHVQTLITRGLGGSDFAVCWVQVGCESGAAGQRACTSHPRPRPIKDTHQFHFKGNAKIVHNCQFEFLFQI